MNDKVILSVEPINLEEHIVKTSDSTSYLECEVEGFFLVKMMKVLF
jgi:hypothetical protein